MRKQLPSLLLIVVMFLIPFKNVTICLAAKNQTTNTTITWPFGLGIAGQLATFSDATAELFSTNYVSVGSNLAYKDFKANYEITYTRFQPAAQLGGASTDGMIGFNIRPKTGLNFKPTSISFDCMRYGTDGGSLDVVWKSSDGTLTTLATAIKPARDNSGAGTHASYDLTSLTVPVSEGECSLQIFVYALGNTKQVGFANIVIQGIVEGTVVNVQTDSISTSVTPLGSGSVTTNPVGTAFDRGTEVTLTATRNFGYAFSHWANKQGGSVSSLNPYTFTLNGNADLIAVFTKINTYSLTMNVNGGGKDYMVTPAPAGTLIDGKLMYEDGVSVTVSAKSNPVISFTNWLSGETSTDISLVMNKDQQVTAEYSAVDYIVGWDFYRTGNGGRAADFSSTTDNESASLILRDASGTTTSWLDKSQVAAGGYEGAPAAVNWKPITGKYYYQISFNAKDFTNIKVSSSMLYNYNAYSKQQCEYSTNGVDFALLGTFTMPSGKVWYNDTFPLPALADHADKVYIRWIPDYTSEILGSASANDGTSISAIYVTATATIFNDGTAPVLSSSVPANNATGASATGKIVLTFDEKVKVGENVTATLGDKVLLPVVSGKTITFAYKALDYDKEYTFSLEGNKVSDGAGNTLVTSISFKFRTMARPAVTKKKIDFVVGVDGDFKAALTAANAASASGNRFYIFFPNGDYNIGANTGDGNQMSTISIPKVSYIGESADKVIVYNKSVLESINSTATMHLTSAATNIYMQDLSLMNKMDYRTGTLKGRGVVLWDQGNKNIYKNVKLLSNQDTYYTGGERSYLENCEIHGTVDFICGGGDLFFNECLIFLEDRSGNCITAPATNSNWGYVFNNCTIDGFPVNNSSYTLGRPWSNAPKCVYINTTMKLLPTSGAWGDPMNVNPSVFAEYNSMTASGASVDLGSRRSLYSKDNVTVNLNPVLTANQAAAYTIENVLGGADAWQPNLFTEQVAAPVIALNGNTISWVNSNYVLCWAVLKNGSFVEFITSNSYVIPSGTGNGTTFTIRAANEMGGLGETSNIVTYGSTGLKDVLISSEVLEIKYYTIDGRSISRPINGISIVKTKYKDGRTTVKKYFSKNDSL